jgi:hypothetical protein
MTRLEEELDRGDQHEEKRMVKTLAGDHYRYYVECWCGDHLPESDNRAEALRVHGEHQREERGW